MGVGKYKEVLYTKLAVSLYSVFTLAVECNRGHLFWEEDMHVKE